MGLIDSAIGIIKEHPVETALGVGVVGVGAGVAVAAIVGKSSKKKTRKSSSKRRRIKHTKRGWAQDRKRRSKQKWEVSYRKRKRHSKRNKRRKQSNRRGIHYTKKGQPYRILSNGRARFIKKTKRRAR